MASMVRQLGVVAVIAAAGAGGWFLWTAHGAAEEERSARERSPPGVVLETAVKDRIERIVAAVGTGRPVRSVELEPSTAGRVTEIGFEGGEEVEAGDLLLALDPVDAEASLAEAKAELERAESAFGRQRTLMRQGRVTESNFEIANAERSVARARVDRARKALEDRTLRAPFDGVARFRTVDVGALVDSDTAIGALDDISSLNVDFAVPERFYGEVELGADVRATTEIFPAERFSGELVGVGRSIDTVSRSFTARARIENEDLRLPADVFMRVELVLETREGVIVPEEAISAEGGERFVYVVKDGRAVQRPVVIGIRRPGGAEIVEGVAVGEEVITRGLQKAADGAPVTILAPETTVSAQPGA